MAYVYDNKTYRNLQQQVKENMDNIAELQDLKLVGIAVKGIVQDYNSLPSSAEQGQVYAVGSASPYELYVYNNSSWVDFGEFPKTGPKGDQGPQGEPGRQGQRGLTGPQGPRGYTGAPGTPGQAGPKGDQGPIGPQGPKGDKGDTGPAGQDGTVSFNELTPAQLDMLKGPKGDTGPQGPQGIQGQEGPMGPKGEQGDPASIKVNGTTYTNDASGLITLPDYPTTTSELTNDSGFLTNASLANYLEKDTFKAINWTNIDSSRNTNHKLTVDLRDSPDDPGAHLLKLERYNYDNGSRVWGTHMSDIGLFVFKDTTSADTINSILSWDSLSLSDLSQNVIFHTDHISINDTKNIPYADIATVSQIPTKTSQLTNNSGFIIGKDLAYYATKTWVEEQGYATKTALRDGLVTKQDVISDLANIRSGAKAGDTAVQPAALSEYAKTSELATVATTGAYSDLSGKPTIPDAVSGTNDGTNWTSLTIGSNTYGLASESGPVNWSDILNKPTFATVATSGSYNDLSNKPTIPTVDYPVTDVTVGGVSVLSNKVATIPALFDGNYDSLNNKPDLSIYALSSSLSTVATSGSYNDLSDKPTIPTTTSQLTNDSNFITSAALTGYATETWVGEQGYQTASQVSTALSGYATTSDVSTAVSTAISSQTKETWTFTLSDGSTVTKSVVLGA